MTKQIIASLIFATGSLATTVFAADPPAAAATAPPAIAAQSPAPKEIIYTRELPSATELNGDAAEQGLIVKEIIRSADRLDVTFQAPDGQTKSVTYEVLRDTTLFPKRATSPAIVFSKTPSPTILDEDRDRANSYPSFRQSDWFPSITFRFDFGRRRQS
jgi:hypothetical protein